LGKPGRRLACLALALLFFCCGRSGPAQAQGEIVSYALVREDGSLVVQGEVIRLFGIYLPPFGRACRTVIRPARCGERGVLALADRIDGFVRCIPQSRNPDGSLNAYCSVEGPGALGAPDEDLGSFLLSRGFALARPEAPFEYHALERIAKAQGRGVWGFPADSFR
jgi:endonuclease YncB( thermonuclease family)